MSAVVTVGTCPVVGARVAVRADPALCAVFAVRPRELCFAGGAVGCQFVWICALVAVVAFHVVWTDVTAGSRPCVRALVAVVTRPVVWADVAVAT